MKPIKAILFDMDGVLILSEDFHFQIKKQLFQRYGSYLTRKEYDIYCAGKRTKDGIEAYLKAKNMPTEQAPLMTQLFQDIKRESLLKDLKKQIPLRTGTEKVLTELSKKYVLAVTTSAIKEFTDKILDAHEIRKYFSRIVTAEEVKEGKPHPEPYLTTAKILSIDPKQCVVIEDAVNGVKSAKAAGMYCIAIVDKKEDDSKFKEADYIIRDLEEVQKILEEKQEKDN